MRCQGDARPDPNQYQFDWVPGLVGIPSYDLLRQLDDRPVDKQGSQAARQVYRGPHPWLVP